MVEDRALSSAEAKIPDVTFKAHFNPAMIRSLQEVRNISDTNSALLLDARSPGRFKGTEPGLAPIAVQATYQAAKTSLLQTLSTPRQRL